VSGAVVGVLRERVAELIAVDRPAQLSASLKNAHALTAVDYEPAGAARWIVDGPEAVQTTISI
jgi:hypothetical protein